MRTIIDASIPPYFRAAGFGLLRMAMIWLSVKWDVFMWSFRS